MINWGELFQMQKELDDRIVARHGLEHEDLIPQRVTAFIVELAEFANEARFFKFWSKDQDPRRERVACKKCDGSGEVRYYTSATCERCHGRGYETEDPLLEEFVDAIHFAIGIGLVFEQYTFAPSPHMVFKCDDAFVGYLNVTELACRIDSSWRDLSEGSCVRWWGNMFGYLLELGRMFGITDDEIVQAYKAKHAENHARQDRGY